MRGKLIVIGILTILLFSALLSGFSEGKNDFSIEECHNTRSDSS